MLHTNILNKIKNGNLKKRSNIFANTQTMNVYLCLCACVYMCVYQTYESFLLLVHNSSKCYSGYCDIAHIKYILQK